MSFLLQAVLPAVVRGRGEILAGRYKLAVRSSGPVYYIMKQAWAQVCVGGGGVPFILPGFAALRDGVALLSR